VLILYRLLPINGEDIQNSTCLSDDYPDTSTPNTRMWSVFIGHEFMEAPLNDLEGWKISRNLVIGPMFNSDRYCQLTVYPFISSLNEDDIAIRYFQQDGATTFTAHFSALQRLVFGEQLISVDVWPPRSPHLSADTCL
jgi:hypothetical protein